MAQNLFVLNTVSLQTYRVCSDSHLIDLSIDKLNKLIGKNFSFELVSRRLSLLGFHVERYDERTQTLTGGHCHIGLM